MADLSALVALLEPALGRRSAYIDLADALRGLIMDGRLVVGDRLPPQRSLADALGLSRTTVVASLGLLRAEGFLESRPGSVTTVCAPPERVERPDEPGWLGHDRGHERPTIDLSIALLPAPAQVIPASQRAVDRLPALLAGGGLHPLGLGDLRAAIAARLTRRGLATQREQIVITQGALHGWDLLLRTFARPGKGVLIEQPSYPAAIDAIRSHHARPQPVAVTAEGWQWPQPRRSPAELAYFLPDFQNPTGHLADDAARRELITRTRGSLLCVDETFAELSDGPALMPTAAFDRGVITIGTLSKLVWAGLRIGWVRGPREVVNRLAAARSSQDIAAPVLDQLLALELMNELDDIAATRRALLSERRQHALAECRRLGWSVVDPHGGMFLWADLAGASSTQLSNRARSVGVRIPPGTRFSASGTHDRFLRVPFTVAPSVLSEALRRITDDEATPRPVVQTNDERDTPSPVWTI